MDAPETAIEVGLKCVQHVDCRRRDWHDAKDHPASLESPDGEGHPFDVNVMSGEGEGL